MFGIKLIVLVSVTLSFTCGLSAESWPPAFCNGIECPKYTTINTTKEYEVRQYLASRWVSTDLSDVDYDIATSLMFRRLFNYISGQNKKGVKIDMTAPVIVKVQPGQGPACENNFTMSFYLAPALVDPPAPSDSKVYLSSLPASKTFVRQFDGFMTESVFLKQAQNLASALPPSTKYNKKFYYTAGYDSPFKFFNRHNEVWFVTF